MNNFNYRNDNNKQMKHNDYSHNVSRGKPFNKPFNNNRDKRYNSDDSQVDNDSGNNHHGNNYENNNHGNNNYGNNHRNNNHRNNNYGNNNYGNNNYGNNKTDFHFEAVNLDTKQLLLKYVYNTIELSNYKYKLIEYEYDLPLLKEKPLFV